MGDRGQVCIREHGDADGAGVWLYTHNYGEALAGIVASALARSGRRDAEYLARIVFCEMVRGDLDGELGYGIGTAEQGDLNNPVVTLETGARKRGDYGDTVTIRVGRGAPMTEEAFVAEHRPAPRPVVL